MSHTRCEYITCPHCGHVHRDLVDCPWSDLDEDGDDTPFDCGSCGREFTVEVHVERTYSTRKLEADAETSEDSGVFKVEAK